MGIQLSDWVENIVRKGEIACYKQFSFFHNVFKSCLLLMHQNEYLWSKGLSRQTNNLISRPICNFFKCFPYASQLHRRKTEFFGMAKIKVKLLRKSRLIMYLTLYHTVPLFNNPGNKAFLKHFRLREKMLTSFSSFPQSLDFFMYK